jgi:hypothetical protein
LIGSPEGIAEDSDAADSSDDAQRDDEEEEMRGDRGEDRFVIQRCWREYP